jgi:hypothetical protein
MINTPRPRKDPMYALFIAIAGLILFAFYIKYLYL